MAPFRTAWPGWLGCRWPARPRAADGGEGGAGMRPGGVLVIEHSDPAADAVSDAPQRLPGGGPGQSLAFGLVARPASVSA